MKLFWTKEIIQKEANKYKTRKDFKESCPNAYAGALSRKILDEVCSHMIVLRRKAYTFEDLAGIALLYKSRGNFQQHNSSAYGAALKKNMLDAICQHMEPSATKPYTFEEIHQEAKKFKTRKSFQLNSPAYKAAWRRGILDKVCSHMAKHVDQSGENNSSFKWKNENILKEALQFDTRTDFKIGNPKAYDVAVQRKIMDQVCSHMKKSSIVSKAELELLNKVKEVYSSATTYRKRDVNIIDKPYIKGFYLDIFVPELNKGIEFDGKYHHSFEGLKRSRKSWPDQDILNYHKYKNEYFLSKNISIIHIKEEDWNLNKEACIKQCLDFLYEKPIL